MQRIPSLYIGPSKLHDRGVFTTSALKKGDLVEISPVIVLGTHEKDYLLKSKLYDYYFLWGNAHDQFAVALGYGSLYNHAYKANIEFVPNYPNRTIQFYCLRDIEAGEELLINYVVGARREDLWFEAV